MGIIFTCLGTNRNGPDQIDRTLLNLRNARKVLADKVATLDGRYNSIRCDAKNHVREKRRQSALLCLQHAKLVSNQAKQATAYAFRLSELYNYIEAGLTTLAVANSMQQARDTLVQLNRQINVEEVEDLLEEIRDNVRRLQEASEAVSAPDAVAHTYDEDELERELAALVEEEQIASLPSAPLEQPMAHPPHTVTERIQSGARELIAI